MLENATIFKCHSLNIFNVLLLNSHKNKIIYSQGPQQDDDLPVQVAGFVLVPV